MEINIPTLQEFFNSFGVMEYLIFFINIIVFFGASKILKLLNKDKNTTIFIKKIQSLRWTNILLFLLFSLSTFVQHDLFGQIIMSGTAIMGISIFWEFEMYYIAKYYTKEEELNGKMQIVETYQSDIFQWLASIVTIILSVNIFSDIWHWDSLWQTGSVIASIAAFLAITHSSWLPDNIGGLITLHKGHIEAGDVIRFKVDGEEILGYAGKITLTGITIFDLVDKHFIYLRNSKFHDVTIHRLSKANSTSKDGILQYIDLNIGYEAPSSIVDIYSQEVFKQAHTLTKSINKERGIRVENIANGDFAVKWRLFYYTNARNMKESEFAMNRAAKDVAETFNEISLDTPQLMVFKQG